MTTLLCLNPASRTGGSTDCEPLVERLHQLGPVVLHRVGEEDLTQALGALEGRLQRIVVGGGDGTLNRSLPTLLQMGVPLGVLPLGTGNDFARSIGLPDDPVEAAQVIVDGRTRRIGLGRANGRPFLNSTGIGLGPELTRHLDHERKKRLGVLAYLTSLIEVVGRRRKQRADLTLDGRTRRVRYLQITIANGIHYGGGMTIAHDARLDDGKLRVLVIAPQTPRELMSRFFKLRRGDVVDAPDPKVQLYTARSVRVDTSTRQEVTVDGELVTVTPVECSTIPDALEVYAPQRALEERVA